MADHAPDIPTSAQGSKLNVLIVCNRFVREHYLSPHDLERLRPGRRDALRSAPAHPRKSPGRRGRSIR
ncbi:MAG: hypothetical protein M1298_05000 [Chloroflexi bacterium]|nr:hypothetical protein [Chloroflexota bacterium]